MGEDPARDLFDRLAGEYLGRPGVDYGRIWHNDGLTVHTKIFAMVVRGQLVLKLPAAQAEQLRTDGAAVAFEPRPGRPMREWVCLDPPTGRAGEKRWRELIADAYAYGDQLGAKAVSRPAASTPPRGKARPAR